MELVEGTARVEELDEFLARLEEIAAEYDSTVQAFDARYVVDREHLDRAVELATRAHERDEAVARERSVEILLYAAGRRQIDRALEMGVSEGECPVVAVVVGGDEADAAETVRGLLVPADTLGEYDPDLVREFFDVSDCELDATAGDLTDAVRERVAMLVVER